MFCSFPQCHFPCNSWDCERSATPRWRAAALTVHAPEHFGVLKQTYPACPERLCPLPHIHDNTSCGLWWGIPWSRWISPAAPQPSTIPRQSTLARRCNIWSRTAAAGTLHRSCRLPGSQKSTYLTLWKQKRTPRIQRNGQRAAPWQQRQTPAGCGGDGEVWRGGTIRKYLGRKVFSRSRKNQN